MRALTPDRLAWLDAAAEVRRARSDGRRGRAVVLVDRGLVRHPVTGFVHRWLGSLGWPSRIETVDPRPGPGSGGPAAVRAVAELVAVADLVTCVGGGSVLDAAKLGTLAVRDDAVLAALSVPQRGGIVLLPPTAVRSAPLVAVPTTLGTGAENSRVAVLPDGRGNRLVMGTALRPEARVLDPMATAGLSDRMIGEGVAEVLARVLGPYIGDGCGSATTDALAESITARLVRLGDDVAAAADAGAATTPELRADIARLSSLSHGEWLARPASPYGVKGWLLANELAFATGVSKMTATCALWPALWRRIGAGDDRLGSSGRLRAAWSVIRAAHDGVLPADPAAGIAELLRRWGLGGPVATTDRRLDTAVHAVNRRWGGGLPMLGGIRPAEVRELLAAAVDLNDSGTALRCPA